MSRAGLGGGRDRRLIAAQERVGGEFVGQHRWHRRTVVGAQRGRLFETLPKDLVVRFHLHREPQVGEGVLAVSYTHLTLPTILIV